MADNLFQIVYSGYTTPLEAQQLKAATDIKTNEAQLGLLEIAQQKATMAGMQQIWGPGGVTGGAIGGGVDKDKLMKTADLLFKVGDVKGGTAALSSAAGIDEKQAVAAKDRQAQEQQRRVDISSVAGAINDQETYSAAFPSLIEKLGNDAVGLKLTGDFQQDQKKLSFLSQAGATWAQRESVAERSRTLDINEKYKALTYGIAEMNARNAQRRTELLAAAGQRSADALEERKREDAARDARLAAGVKNDPAKEYTKNLKVDNIDLKLANDSFAIDPRTTDMDPALQKKYSELAARRAKESVANQLRVDPKSSVNFDTEMGKVMDQMESEGLFTPTGSDWMGNKQFKYQPPSWTNAKNAGQGTPSGGAATKGNVPADQFPSADSVAKAYKAGKLTRDQAAEILKKKGWAQ